MVKVHSGEEILSKSLTPSRAQERYRQTTDTDGFARAKTRFG